MVQGKVVLVTGGFGALGTVVGRAAAAAGADVALVDRAPAPSLPSTIFAVGDVDLTSPEAAADAVKAVTDRFGRLDALINVAGGFAWQTLADGDFETWSRLYALNVLTAAAACKAALPALIAARGAVVNVGANGAVKAAAGMGAYAASKAGVHKLTESLAEELKGKVRVNAVLPSIIDTDANRADMPNADFAAWVTPEEVAEAILFLASDRASGVTGALLPVLGRV
jgi:NAD(P)-dependent dehydrogenase (short-subunit alcohol dehydrogenase family)